MRRGIHIHLDRKKTSVISAVMVRGTNKCAWLMRSRKEKCGRSCVGAYCRQHNYQLKKGMKMPAPCSSCGVGVLSDYRLYVSCGRSVLKHRVIRKRKKAKKAFKCVLAELKATVLENVHLELYHSKNEQL